MFVLEEGATVRLPAGVEKIVTAFSASGRLGGYGDEHAWPLATLADGTQRDLRQIGPKRTQDAEKYYVKGKLPAGWCELTYPQSQLTLRLEFPVEQVPYLGVLPNEGGWQDLYNIFLEPATGPLDRLDVARLHGQHSTVEGGGTLRVAPRHCALRQPMIGCCGIHAFHSNRAANKSPHSFFSLRPQRQRKAHSLYVFGPIRRRQDCLSSRSPAAGW